MCEIGDVSFGHHDIYLDRCTVHHFGRSMMEFYITDSFQDMLDIDIKSEMATDLGSTTDFSDTLGVSFSDLPPLLDIDMDNATTWIAGSNSSSHNSSNFVHNLDLYGSEANAVMVNPNSVMPSIFSESPQKKKSDHDSCNVFNSASSDSASRSSTPSSTEIKIERNLSSELTHFPKLAMKIKKEPLDDDSNASADEEETTRSNSKFIFIKKEEPIIKEELIEDVEDERANLPTNIIPNLRIKTSQPEILKINGKNCSILSSNQSLTSAQFIKAQTGTQTIISGNIHILGHQQSRALLSNTNKGSATILIDNGTLNNNRQVLKPTTIPSSTFNDTSTTKYVPGNKLPYCAEFPKPAYSYSCLIAMALKNSRTGSLPVAEIYNFMCQHFPYFKTAPNGWKNSVRHNLSLNKCFEKIEKPSTNGGQRKGCLWAMNPSKVGKMDEEVQKWSRKDPQAIRKAMVRPDSLEALERGEMKFCSEGGGGEDYGSEEEELDVDEAYLVSSSPAGSPALVQQFDDETSDVEVMEGVEIEESKPLMLEFSLASSQIHTESPAKRPKTNFIYQTVNATTPHVNRRKAPLINRIA